MHFSILLGHTSSSMHCWKDSSGMPLVTALLMASTPSKQVPLMIPLSLGKRKSHMEQAGDWGKKKVTWNKQVNREVVPVWQCSSQPGTAGGSGRCAQVCCHGEAATICPATTLVSSHALTEANAKGSLCRLADWSSGPVARTHCGRCLWHQRTWSTWLWLLIVTVLLSSVSATLDIFTDSSGTWFLGRTKKSMSYHQWWLYEACLVQFEDAWWCPDTPACGTPSDHHSAALAPFLHPLSAWDEL